MELVHARVANVFTTSLRDVGMRVRLNVEGLKSQFDPAARQIALDLGIDTETLELAKKEYEGQADFFFRASGTSPSGPSFIFNVDLEYEGSAARINPEVHAYLEITYEEYAPPFHFEQDIASMCGHPKFLERWAAWAVYTFHLRHKPINLENLFGDDYIRVWGAPLEPWPTMSEFKLLMRGLQNSGPVTILKLRHVSDDFWDRSYSYAILADSIASQGLWIFFCDSSGLDSGGAYKHYRRIEQLIVDLGEKTTVKTYDVEYAALESFLLRKARNFNTDDDNFGLEALHRLELTSLGEIFGPKVSDSFGKSEQSFWNTDYAGALRDLRAVVQDSLVVVAKARSIDLTRLEKPNINNIAKKLCDEKVLDNRLRAWFEAFTSFANIASHGNFPSDEDWKNINTRARVLSTFAIGRQLLLEMVYCLMETSSDEAKRA